VGARGYEEAARAKGADAGQEPALGGNQRRWPGSETASLRLTARSALPLLAVQTGPRTILELSSRGRRAGCRVALVE
jgi:hypothetical protein